MSETIQLSYDAAAKRAVLTFPNGRELTLDNVTEDQAKAFKERHAPEFMKRDCVLHAAGGAVESDHE
jgi:hypothetical protein